MRFVAALCVALAFFAVAADAQTKFPPRTVTIVVPYPPGGSNDTFARELGERLSEAWKVPVIVENKPGAGGSIGAAFVSKAAADGYTLMLLSSSFTTNAAIQPNLPFDPVAGFTPSRWWPAGPMILTVTPKAAREDLRRVPRLRERQSRQAQLRLVGPGQHQSLRHGTAHGRGRASR